MYLPLLFLRLSQVHLLIAAATRSSLMHINIGSSVTIPVDDSPALSPPSTPSLNGSSSYFLKRPSGDVDKDPQVMADELALKHAKNTDAV